MRNHRLRIVLAVFASALASVGVLAYGLGSPQATLLGPALVRDGDPAEVMLTFDDGPSVPYTGEILDILRAKGVKATFFLCGASAERYPELVRRIRDEGHEIGNHTWSHPWLYLASRESMASEIDRTQDVLERITGTRPVWFRPPFGVRGFPLWDILRERGMKMMLWSDRGHDGDLDAAGISKITLAQLHPGAIVLLHDGFEARASEFVDRSATVSALPGIIDGVRRAGYRLAPAGRAASSSAPLLAAEGAAGSTRKPSSSRP
ncbi:MAG: polysaccharide deacetylase family protein [Elusimicrobia bacterium]|nr:polysaccharide deacetylase family protein [Elusimicrobiota bacterium]